MPNELTPEECAERLETIADDTERIIKCHGFSQLCLADVSTLKQAAAVMRKLAAGELREVVHARWIEYSGEDKGFHYCSKCERQAFNFEEENGAIIEILSDYCPSCGALMDAKEDNNATD